MRLPRRWHRNLGHARREARPRVTANPTKRETEQHAEPSQELGDFALDLFKRGVGVSVGGREGPRSCSHAFADAGPHQRQEGESSRIIAGIGKTFGAYDYICDGSSGTDKGRFVDRGVWGVCHQYALQGG